MTKKTTVSIAILALIAGVSILASRGNLVAYAAPRIQATDAPRPTPTNEPQPTEPTDTPESPTDTPEPPTDTPIPPTKEPKPTSKPKKPRKSSGEPDPTSVPPAPTAAVPDAAVPTTGFGGVGGWTVGITGLILVCILVVARRLRMGIANRQGRSDTDGLPSNHRHP